MYFWKIEKLKDELVYDGLSQSQLFKYVLINAFFVALAIEVFGYFPTESYNVFDIAGSVAGVALAVVGTYLCYVFNGGAKGAQFAERYFSIGFVVAIRFMVLLVPIVIVMGIIMAAVVPYESDVWESSQWYETVALTLWTAGMWWRIIHHINDVAKRSSQPESAELRATSETDEPT